MINAALTNTQTLTIIPNDSPLKNIAISHSPKQVIKKAEEELANKVGNTVQATSNVFKALTLSEFENGVLLSMTVPDHYKTFAIDLSRQFQEEYKCITASEKATCELAAISYVRTLVIQRKITNLLEESEKDKESVAYFSILSKELDRANRHFTTAIQTLQINKQPQFAFTIKAKNANFANQQIVNTDSHE